jgi:hypothetical protein
MVNLLSKRDREEFMEEIVLFAREIGQNNPVEVQGIIWGSALIVGMDLVASSISDLQSAVEAHTEALTEAIRETIPEKDDD